MGVLQGRSLTNRQRNITALHNDKMKKSMNVDSGFIYVLNSLGGVVCSLDPGSSWARHSHLTLPLLSQAPVIQRLDNTIHRVNHYPADSVVCFVNTYPLDSDLSGG